MSYRSLLLRNTVLWLGAVVWVVWGYLIQDPAPDPWTAATRNGFTVAATLVIAVVSLALVIAWVMSLRGKAGARAGGGRERASRIGPPHLR